MRCNLRRPLAGLTGLAVLVSLVVVASDLANAQVPAQTGKAPAAGQPKAPGAPGTPGAPPDPADLPGATLPTDTKLKRKLEAVKDYLDKEDWGQVAKTGQELLDLSEDIFVPVPVKDAKGKETVTLVGIRVATNRLLGTMPRGKPGVGLDVYNTVHGANARKILGEALAAGDKQLFADVAHRFLYTDAGAEASERLGTLLLDRGDFTAAAQAFERLLERDPIEKLEGATLFKVAIAFHRAGDKDAKEKVWKALVAKAPDGLKLGTQTVSLTDLEKLLDRYRASTASAYDYPQFGGDEARNAQLVGGPPFMVHAWKAEMTDIDQIKAWVFDGPSSAVKRLEARGNPVLPALYPIAVTTTKPSTGARMPIVVYRDYKGLSAIDIKTGRLEWRSPSDWSLEGMLNDSQKSGTLDQWLRSWREGQASKPAVVLENSTLGSLSTDGSRVYAVDDLAVPPPPMPQQDPRFGGWAGNQPAAPYYSNQKVTDATAHNTLSAINLATGKLLWTLGGRRPANEPERKDPKDFQDSYFLGPPLCLGGRLYLLNEKQQDLRLVCLDPNRMTNENEQERRDAVLWVQTLCTAKEKMLGDYMRRTTAAHIAFGEGILVCPTNAGVLLGVDVLSHSLVWAHPYRDPGAAPPQAMTQEEQMMQLRMGGRIRPGMQPTPTVVYSDWKNAAPVIADGRVVFTAPDGGEVRCVQLRNGAKLWGQKRGEDDLYLAGVWSGRVVLVGKKAVRALALDDGKELWRRETGLPSGRGVASDNVYYLPLKEYTNPVDKAKGPAVVALNVETGRVVSVTHSRPGRPNDPVSVPGNLIFFDGDVLSQSVSEMVVYPQLAKKERHMDERLARNNRDAEGLLERAELRLDRGNRLGAVEDLRDCLAQGPTPALAARARGKMLDALAELMQHDFKSGKPFLKEYEALCKVEVDATGTPAQQELQKIEGKKRRAHFLALYAKGMEGEGQLAEALSGYLEYAALGGPLTEMLPVVDEPAIKAPADVWARGRIAALFAAAGPEKRAPLEKSVIARWQEAKASGDLDKVRSFVTLFGASLPVGREARLHLAERLAENDRLENLIEAERHLLLLEQEADTPETAARAVERLARLLTRMAQAMERTELLEDAAHYYRVLRDRYGNVVVRDGKTGAQLHKELAADRRFLLFLEEPSTPRARKMSSRDEHGSFQPPSSVSFTFEPAGDVLSSCRRQRLSVSLSGGNATLEWEDRRGGDRPRRFAEPLKATNLNQFLPQMSAANNAGQGIRYGYQSVGHLLVVNLGSSVAAFDPFRGKVLWEKSLFGDQGPQAGSGSGQALDAEGSLRINYDDGYFRILGQAGPVAASYVCLQSQDGLSALDPLTGRELWRRTDVPTRCRIFGDDAHVYLVELEDRTGTPTTSRAFRAQDGATVVVPSFATAYKNRQRLFGRIILTQETSPTTGLTLKLYDVHTGQDVWSKTYPVGSVPLRSDETDLIGAVGPDGRCSVVSLRARKEVVVGLARPEDLQNLKEAHLLSDGDFVYVLFNQQNPQTGASVMTNLLPTYGLRGVKVNGRVYAFERRTSRIKWHADVPYQELVLEQWKEMPVLLFTGRFVKMVNVGGNMMRPGNQQLVAVTGINKATGKWELDHPELGPQTQQFHTLRNDPRTGQIELVGGNYKATLTVDDNQPAAARGGSGGR